MSYQPISHEEFDCIMLEQAIYCQTHTLNWIYTTTKENDNVAG
jgi:hypothetical protein